MSPTHITISLALTVTILAAALSQNIVTASHHAAPAPAVDCTTVVLSLVDCLSYVSQGSAVKKPEGSCCSGLKTVLKSNPECLCETFKNSAQFGVSLNLTKAMALPQACKLSAPSVSNCGASIGEAPAQSPTPLTPSSISGAPTTTVAANDFSPAIAPTPGSTTSSAFAVSATSLVLSVICASFSLF